MIIVNNEAALRIPCTDVLPEEVGDLRAQLEFELDNSARLGRPGIGLAAIQIGIPKNMAIVRTERTKIDLVNCQIVKSYDKAIFEQEGCLSFPGRVENTWRYQEIVVANNMVEPANFIATGLLAVVVQHELDHMNSIILPDLAIVAPKPSNAKIRPNDLCPCNSKRKYKKCCGK
jgi:peptide deformylase